MRIMVFHDVFNTHKNAPPVTEDRSCCVLRIECGRVPVAANDRRKRPKRVEVIENDLHLPTPMGTRAMGIEMNCYSSKHTGRALDVGDQRTQMTDALFFA